MLLAEAAVMPAVQPVCKELFEHTLAGVILMSCIVVLQVVALVSGLNIRTGGLPNLQHGGSQIKKALHSQLTSGPIGGGGRKITSVQAGLHDDVSREPANNVGALLKTQIERRSPNEDLKAQAAPIVRSIRFTRLERLENCLPQGFSLLMLSQRGIYRDDRCRRP